MNKKILFVLFALFSFMASSVEKVDYQGFKYLSLPPSISTNSYKNLAYHANVENLHSNKSRDRKIVLDFCGRIVYGSAWNEELKLGDTYKFQPWTIDLSSNFNYTERQRIFNIWRIVGDAFPHYDVTTELLPDWDINKEYASDPKYGARVLITTRHPSKSIGSLGYYDSFGDPKRNLILIFAGNLDDQIKNIADHIIQQVKISIGEKGE